MHLALLLLGLAHLGQVLEVFLRHFACHLFGNAWVCCKHEALLFL